MKIFGVFLIDIVFSSPPPPQWMPSAAGSTDVSLSSPQPLELPPLLWKRATVTAGISYPGEGRRVWGGSATHTVVVVVGGEEDGFTQLCCYSAASIHEGPSAANQLVKPAADADL